MTTGTMELRARSPEWLAAKADVQIANREASAATGRVQNMERINGEHAAEIAEKARSGLPLLTNGQVARRGAGMGVEVIYSRCSCSGFPPEDCAHDATDTPYPDKELAAAIATAAAAQKAVAEAIETLALAPQDVDVFAAAKTVGALYVWWPQETNVDPRKRRYRGQPATDAEIQSLGIHGIRKALADGGLIEVPA